MLILIEKFRFTELTARVNVEILSSVFVNFLHTCFSSASPSSDVFRLIIF